MEKSRLNNNKLVKERALMKSLVKYALYIKITRIICTLVAVLALLVSILVNIFLMSRVPKPPVPQRIQITRDFHDSNGLGMVWVCPACCTVQDVVSGFTPFSKGINLYRNLESRLNYIAGILEVPDILICQECQHHVKLNTTYNAALESTGEIRIVPVELPSTPEPTLAIQE